MEKILAAVRQNIRASLQRNPAEGILLSGGIDSGILAYLAPHTRGITVSLEGHGDDLRSISLLRGVLDHDPILVTVTVDDALAALREVIMILQSFDPALPNDLAVFFGMREAKRHGISSIMTGDGGDELCGGYPYMQEIEDLDQYIRGMSRSWSFSSNRIGEHFNLEVKQPYLDAAFVAFALTLTRDVKIREDNGKVWGKWCLRKAFESLLPPAFIWQGKRPLEVGSGMTLLRSIIAQRISDNEFEEKQREYKVTFLCKEHLYFYEIYREVVGEVPAPRQGEDRCPGCGTGIPRGKRHCRVCGWVT